MYKLLIVDDEELEREGMAEFIPWENYDVKLVGTAWNGMEGYEKIQVLQPDIVMTDIKMPVMNGLELIHKTKEQFPDIEFIVLSGYGEYEFSSQAMEDGVRYYILKPCDEEKICTVLEKVKADLREKESVKKLFQKQNVAISKLLPRAREQVFMNMLSGKEQMQEEYQLFIEENQLESLNIRILLLKYKDRTEFSEQLKLENLFNERLGKCVLASTVVRDQICFMLYEKNKSDIEPLILKIKEELSNKAGVEIYAALSGENEITNIKDAYLQVEELLKFCELEQWNQLLSYEEFKEEKQLQLIDYECFFKSDQNTQILLELYLVFCKMEYRQYTLEHKRKICQGIFRILSEQDSILPQDLKENNTIFACMIDVIIIDSIGDKEMKRFWEIKKQIWMHLSDQKLSIKYLAKEEMFMNEDYFGRFFQKYQNMKFSTYVLEQRIEVAKRLLEYDPDMKVNKVVEMVGFPEDGQYFSRAFKKQVGISPSEYRDRVIGEMAK